MNDSQHLDPLRMDTVDKPVPPNDELPNRRIVVLGNPPSSLREDAQRSCCDDEFAHNRRGVECLPLSRRGRNVYHNSPLKLMAAVGWSGSVRSHPRIDRPCLAGTSCCKANDFKFSRSVYLRQNLLHALIDRILDRVLTTVVALERRKVLQDDNAVLGDLERKIALNGLQ